MDKFSCGCRVLNPSVAEMDANGYVWRCRVVDKAGAVHGTDGTAGVRNRRLGTGMSAPWSEVRQHLTDRAAGKPAVRPKARKFGLRGRASDDHRIHAARALKEMERIAAHLARHASAEVSERLDRHQATLALVLVLAIRAQREQGCKRDG
jgi:hypothetical protein